MNNKTENNSPQEAIRKDPMKEMEEDAKRFVDVQKADKDQPEKKKSVQGMNDQEQMNLGSQKQKGLEPKNSMRH